MRHVERAKPHAAPGEEDRVYPPPQFIVPLQNITQMEGGKIHFETRIEPVGDPTMQVQWYRNGQSLEASELNIQLYLFQYIFLILKFKRKKNFFSRFPHNINIQIRLHRTRPTKFSDK